MAGHFSSQPQVSVCLSGVASGGNRRVRVELEEIEVSAGGPWVSLLKQPMTVSSEQAAKGMLLDRAQVAAGQYQRVRYRIGKAVIEQDGGETVLRTPAQPVEYPLAKPLTLENGDSVCVFVHWDLTASLRKAPDFLAAFTLTEQRIPLTTELAFVTCPEINTVYIIRTDQNRICGAWGLAGRPTSIHASKVENTLYALVEEQAVIVAMELSNGKVRDRIRIPMAVRPSFMAVDEDGRNAFVIEQSTGMVYRVDLGTGSLAAQVRLGERPDYCVFWGEGKVLAVSSSQSQKVVLLDPSSLRVRQSIAVGNAPEGVAGYAGTLYVAEGRANTVGMYHVGGETVMRQYVGQGPSRILVHDRMLFVANAQGGSIGMVRPEQLAVVRDVPTGGAPGEMAVSASRNWLYAVDTKGSGLIVLDLSSQKLGAGIDLKARPFDVAVIQ